MSLRTWRTLTIIELTLAAIVNYAWLCTFWDGDNFTEIVLLQSIPLSLIVLPIIAFYLKKKKIIAKILTTIEIIALILIYGYFGEFIFTIIGSPPWENHSHMFG